MTTPPRSFWDSVLCLWSSIGRNSGRRQGIQQVVLHDPEAQKPKDLDNPFRDVSAQDRVGDLIGRAYPDLERKTKK
jgi:hypothetical protein